MGASFGRILDVPPPVKRSWPPEFGPYDPSWVVYRIRQRMNELGKTPKDMHEDPVLKENGIRGRSAWSQKQNEEDSFTPVQLSRICLVLRGWPGFPYTDAPPGWRDPEER